MVVCHPMLFTTFMVVTFVACIKQFSFKYSVNMFSYVGYFDKRF